MRLFSIEFLATVIIGINVVGIVVLTYQYFTIPKAYRAW